MAKARGVDAKLTRLRSLRNEDVTPKLLAELRALLGDSSNFVAAGAAEIVGEQMLADLAPDLVAAFQRFLIDPAETDKICKAKIAIAQTLNKLEYDAEDVFRAALKHVQMEPRWGGSDDTAAPLRGEAAFALVRLNPRDLVILLADLLADPEKAARSAAARALGACGRDAVIPLLRFKARAGDKEPEVVADCLAALVSAEPGQSIPFVGEFLDDSDDEVAEGAALALAEWRRPEALDLLLKHWPKARRREIVNVVLLAIAITRLPAALEFLLEVLNDKAENVALGALAALAIHKHNPAVRERIASAVPKSSAGLRARFAKDFPRVDE